MTTCQIVFKKNGIVMLMEDSELRERAENILDKLMTSEDMKAFNSDAASRKYAQVFMDGKNDILSLLDKCKNFNAHSQKWSKPPETHIAKDTPDCLKLAIDVTMKRLENWSPKSWADLVKELKCEMKVAYDKFLNLRKKYSGLIEISRGYQGSELIKAYIARDLQDYVKYGINISLQCVRYCGKSLWKWVRKIAIHFEMLARELEGLNVRNEDELRRLAEDVSLYKQCMLDFADNSVRSLDDSTSKAYMMLRQKGGIPFSDVIERKKNELGFADHFNSLEDSQQEEVYQGIINEFDGENTSKFQFVAFLFSWQCIFDDIRYISLQ